MEALLLVGTEDSELKKLKVYLLKQGFHATLMEPADLKSLEDGQGRYVLGIVEASTTRLRDLAQKVRNCRALAEVPLLALIKEGSAASDLASVQGLEDYQAWPCTYESVETRIRFLLKKLNHLSPGTGKRIGALEINVDRYEVLLDGEPLELTYKEFELFKFLATHPSRVFSRDQLLNQVWGYNFIGGTRTVDVHVRRLRAKLGPKHGSLIDTVRNVGYKFLESL